MLSFLLGENISDEIAVQVSAKRADISIFSLHHWEGGRLLHTDDETVIRAATQARLTLVTYDQKTIPPLLVRLAEAGFSHTGILFVDGNSIPSDDFGALVRALITYWDDMHPLDWTDRLGYLRPAP